VARRKIVIGPSDLPPIDANEKGYVFRYRIVSEDKSQVSHWSPQYAIPFLGPEDNPADMPTVDAEKVNRFAAITWYIPERYNADTVDVYVQWGQGGVPSTSWTYLTRSYTNTASAEIPSGVNQIWVWLQYVTSPREKINEAFIVQTASPITV
jgi:hypothetical protein